MLSHELRNPLAAIAGALAVAERRVSGADPALAPALEIGKRQVGHISRMLDDLLDVARITRGTIVLHPQRLDVATAIERAIETVRPKIESRQHELSVESREAVWVEADPVRLSQAIANLLDNAAKYTPREAGLRLAPRKKDRRR